jgi:plastocyanin
LALALAAAGPLTGRAAQHRDRSAGHAHTVIIEAMSFKPQVLVAHPGDRIIWINKDPFPHTVTSTDGKFDSHLIAPDGSWTYVARKVGEYDYVCALHVTMKGRVEVR